MPTKFHSEDSQSERLRAAIGMLRDYEPLAAHVLELAVLLDRLADIALADILAEDRENGSARTGKAIEHLREAVHHRRKAHVESAMQHVAQALRHLAPKKD